MSSVKNPVKKIYRTGLYYRLSKEDGDKVEDQYGLTIDVIQSRLCLVFDTHLMDSELFGMLTEWLKLRWEMEDGDQTRKDYNIWRYNVPEMIVEDYKHRHVDLPTRD